MSNFVKLAVFLLIFLNILPSSFVKQTVNVEHFSSSHHIFEYASHHDFQYGVDIIDNVGPYGYLHYPYTYAGGVFWVKILWFALICFVYAYYATSLASRIRSLPEKLLFLFAVIFFPLQVSFPWFSYEIIPRLAILFSAIHFLTGAREEGSWRENTHVIFNGLFYALLTLEKASNVYYLAFLILILSAYWLLRSRWRIVLWLVGSYLSGVTVFWLAAGQQLSNLPTFFKSMSFFINAYQEVMVQEMGTKNLLYGLFYCGAASVLVFLRMGTSFFITPARTFFPAEIFRSVLVAALFFLVWKHGVVRNVLSYGTFVYAVPTLFAYLCLYPIATQSESSEGNPFAKWFSLQTFSIFRSVLLASLLMIVLSNAVTYQNELGLQSGIRQELSGRLSALAHYRPAQTLKVLDAQFEGLKSANALPPSLKTAMESSRVDEFGESPEILLLNELDYRPRPVPINFIAANYALNDKNGGYYQNPETAPDFVLIPDFGLRLADTSAYLSLLFNYQAVQSFKDALVMKKRSPWKSLELRALPSRNRTRFDEWVSLTERQNIFLWVEIDIKPTILARVKNFLYKPDRVRLDILLEDGSTQVFFVSLSALRSGFLVNPVIKTKNSLLWLAKDKSEAPWSPAKAFRIALDSPGKSGLFRPDFNVKFSVIASASHADSNAILVDLPRAMASINLIAPNFPMNATKLPMDLFTNEAHDDISVERLGGLESNDKESWRWALGPETRIKFYVDPASPDQARQLLLKFSLKNAIPIPDQTVTIRLNGKVIRHFSSKEIGVQKLIDVDVALVARKGVNILEIVYHDWNHKKTIYATHDSRELAVVIMRLALQGVE